MKISFALLAAHFLCTALLVFCSTAWKADKRWIAFFAALFFISEPAVFLVFGPFHYYVLYAADFVLFLGLAGWTPRFYAFLLTQEDLVRWLFWSAVGVFAAAVIVTGVFEITLRRDELTFWKYMAQSRPTAYNINRLADSYYHLKDYRKAEENYVAASQLNGSSIKAFEGLVEVAEQAGQWKRIISLCHKIITLRPQSARTYLHMARAFRGLGDSKDAVDTYSRLLNLFPDDEKIYIKVIEAYGKAIAQAPQEDIYKEKREEVLADFEELSRRKNYTAADFYNLGFLYEQVGGKDEAIRFYTKAVQMKPDYAGALLNLADLYKDTGNYKEAMALYSRLIHFYPKNVQGYLNMGIIFNALGDKERARRFYLKVVDLDPESGDAYFNLGYLSESQGELSDAVNYYERAVEFSPKNAEAYYNLGNVYASLGQNSEAIASYLKTVAINPRHQNAFVNLSILSFKSRDFKGAIHYLEEAQGLGYNPPVAYLKTLEPYR